MSTEVISGGLGEIRAVSAAGGGTALTTTPAFIGLRGSAHHIFITPRNFSTAVVVKFARNPYLVVLRSTNAMAGAPTDYSGRASAWSLQDTFGNGALYLIGSHQPIRGFYVDVNLTNASNSVMTVYYWKGSWANTSATDGTAADGKTLAQDGLVYWTPPTDITPATLNEIYAFCTNGTGTCTGSPKALTPGRNIITVTAPGTFTIVVPPGVSGSVKSGTATITPAALSAGANVVDTGATTGTFFIDYSLQPPSVYFNETLHWYQVRVSAQLDATVSATAIYAANQSTAYAELIPNQTFEEKIHVGVGGFGCVEALTDAGTANLIVNVAAPGGGRLS
jgi:hypothetical protein